MAARNIEYVELYTSNWQATVDYFGQALGFIPVAESASAGLSSVLLRQGSVQLIVTAGDQARAFLDAHGDGIADIALRCDDPLASRDAAVAAGATELDRGASDPVVSGCGAGWHTLLPRSAAPGPRLPAGRCWTLTPATAAVTASQAGRIRQLDHVAICLAGRTLDEHADFYSEAFGLARYSSEYIDIGDQALDSIVVRSQGGGVTFTLVAPDPAKSPGQLDSFLGRNGGPGVQHLAFEVADIIAAVGAYGADGVEFLSTPSTYYDMLAERFTDLGPEIAGLQGAHVLADRDEWGYLLQIFTRSPHERNTLFYELVQRRGARGFGVANIRALYEAVERDRLVAE